MQAKERPDKTENQAKADRKQTGLDRERGKGIGNGPCRIIGNLGRDPELRATQNGSSIATLSVATSESWTDKSTGERVERTEWHRVVVLNNDGLCKLVERCLVRGSKVYVEGQIRTRKWTDREGVERYATEIHVTPYGGAITFLDSKRDNDERTPSRQPATAGGSTGADLDDDVPFGPCWQ